MNRLVYVAGFGNSLTSAEQVGQTIQKYGNYEDFDAFDLGFALANPELVAKATKKVDAYSHSAGLIALIGTYPKTLHAFSAPLPTTRRRLIKVTLDRMRHEEKPESPRAAPQAIKYQDSSNREFLVHPVRNLGPFITGRISKFHGINATVELQKQGISSGMAYADKDALFHPTPEELDYARQNGVMVAEIPGFHGELVDNPARALDNYYQLRTT